MSDEADSNAFVAILGNPSTIYSYEIKLQAFLYNLNLTVAGLSSGASAKQTEIDFGSGINQIEGLFNVVDANCATTSRIVAQIAYKSPSDGRSIDEIAWESFDIFCNPKAGNFDMLLKSRNGPVTGKFVVFYMIGG